MPRISANKLGEFLTTANPVRRRRILTDQKYPNGAVVPRYRHALDPIASFLRSGGDDTDSIYTAIDRLRSDESGTDWAIEDRKNTADALECFLELSERLPSENITYQRGETDPPKMYFNGVEVSIRPDFILLFERRGKPCIGALKFHFTKTEELALQQRGSEYVSTLLYRWLHANAPHNRRPSHSHCFSIDVFRQSVVAAPASFLRRVAEIEAACEEISSRWESV